MICMSSADRIIHEFRTRKRRFDAAVSAIELLTIEQRKELIVVLLDRVESVTVREASTASPARNLVRGAKQTKTNLAEALVLERPGMSTAEIVPLIKQDRAAADCTLRQVAKRRGTIERRDGRWYPTKPSGGSNPTAN